MKIAIIIGSTRDSRITARLANWVAVQAVPQHTDIQFEVLDIKSYDIPFLNEDPWNPQRHLSDGTAAWLSALAGADGYIVVTAEHNHGIPAPLKNALDFTNGEMNRKPALIVSHGSVSGARSTEQLRLVLNSNIGVVPVPQSVTFYGNVQQVVSDDGVVDESAVINNDKLSQAINELVWYTGALTAAK